MRSDNLLGWFLIVAGVLYAAGALVAAYMLHRHFREPSGPGAVAHAVTRDPSFWWLTAGMAAIFYLPPLELLYLRAHATAAWLELAGALLALPGGLLFLSASRSRMVQPWVAAGPYRFLRHPDYAGYLLAGLGVTLGHASLWGAATLLLILLPAVLWRIRQEEKSLRVNFGAQFVEYVSRTKRLIPGVW